MFGFLHKKTAEEHLAEAEKHAAGNTLTQKSLSVVGGGLVGSIYALVGYVSYRIWNLGSSAMRFFNLAKENGLNVQGMFRHGGFKEQFTRHYDKFYDVKQTFHYPAGSESASRSLSTVVDGAIHGEIHTPTKLGKAYQNARDAFAAFKQTFTKKGIKNFLHQSPAAATTIGIIGAVMGVSAWHNSRTTFKEGHARKVAHHFTEALKIDQESLANELESVPKGMLTIEKAREIAAHRPERKIKTQSDSFVKKIHEKSSNLDAGISR
jgi:hypothetical protein